MLEVKVYENSKNSFLEWLDTQELFEKELNLRNSQGSSESLDNWLDKLITIYSLPSSFGVAIYKDNKPVACALVFEGMSLHQDNLACIFGMVATSQGSKLLREVIKVARSKGFEHLHISKKVNLTTYETKVIKL